MIKANNEKELLQILKIISEESVKKAKKGLYENTDPAQSSYKKAMEYEENRYDTSLSEQEDEEENVDAEVEEPAPDAAEDEEPEEKVVKKELDPESFGKNFEDVVKDINTLRSGRSTKDKEIKEELVSYYDRLSEPEQAILHLFIKELSDILKGAIDGDNAQDPSDPPFNFKVSGGESQNTPKEDNDTPEEEEEEEADTKQKGVEDTSPPLPVAVNERQDLSEIRKRVSRLMKRY